MSSSVSSSVIILMVWAIVIGSLLTAIPVGFDDATTENDVLALLPIADLLFNVGVAVCAVADGVEVAVDEATNLPKRDAGLAFVFTKWV
jgi:hypothetical protein